MAKDKDTPSWTQAASPFHEGEQAIQAKLGIRDKMEGIGRRFIRNYMPDQHRQFYEQLPFVMAGSVDSQGRPWASLLAGKPGFITAPDERTLQLQVQPLAGDPLSENLCVGVDLGLLGIQLETRRRNRVNGTVSAIANNSITVGVTQSFGNCPQYIQKRQLHWLSQEISPTAVAPQQFTQFTASMQLLISQADTLFIATSYTDGEVSLSKGVDVSHRGGKPGFVRIEGDRTLIFPDFSGNNFYNTLGNIALNNRASLLFPDFEQGHILTLTGHADIIWEGTDLDNFKGAERLIRVTAEDILHLPAALPFRWDFQEYSPSLNFTGQWPSVA